MYSIVSVLCGCDIHKQYSIWHIMKSILERTCQDALNCIENPSLQQNLRDKNVGGHNQCCLLQ